MEKVPIRWSSRTPLIGQLVAALALPGSVTLLAILDEHPPTAIIVLLFVVAVVLAALLSGAAGGIVASVASFLALNFFFTEPFHTFSVAAPEDLVALFVFLAASATVGILLSSALDARAAAQRGELQTRLLNKLATRLLAGESTDRVLQDFAGDVCEALGLARLRITTTFTEPVEKARAEVGEHLRVRLKGGTELGEIEIWGPAGGRLGTEQRDFVTSLANQLALALESQRLSAEVRRAELEAQANELKAALFSGITHDVKTPLAAIMAAVTSLLEGSGFSEADRQEHLLTIREQAERLHRVVNNLLELARLRAGALVPKKALTPIDELMESVLNRLRPMLAGRPLEMRVADDVPEIPMDVVLIDQVLTNVIENAAKFTPPGTPITLSAIGATGSVRITVADRGPGVPRADRTRVFEPFERGGASVPGTGLGLAISQAIVAAHGGRMWVSDNPQGGAAFTFELPLDAAAQREEVSDAGARAGR